jgi:tricorn protease
LLALITLISISWHSSAINTEDTRLMQLSALSQFHIAFIYANDLWIADRDGTYPRRLTSDVGIESNPYFSPDGKYIAFNAEYDGNTDVFIIPAEGGIPKRLTWHPSPDLVRGFSPDGKAVLFASPRKDYSNRYLQLFTIPITGGYPTRLIIPNAYQATWSPEGNKMAYTPISPVFRQWKNYRGGYGLKYLDI